MGPDKTPAQKMLKKGCEIFTKWGWTSGTPVMKFQPVECPAELVKRVRGGFGPDGVKPVILPNPQATKPKQPVSLGPPVTGGQRGTWKEPGTEEPKNTVHPKFDMYPLWMKWLFLA